MLSVSPPGVPPTLPPGEAHGALEALEPLGAGASARLRPTGHLPVDADRPDAALRTGRSRRGHEPGARPGPPAEAVPTAAAPLPQPSAPARAPDGPLGPLLPAPLRPARGGGSPGLPGRWPQGPQGGPEDAGGQEAASGVHQQLQARVDRGPLLPGPGAARAWS